MIAEHIPLTVEELAKQVELLRGSVYLLCGVLGITIFLLYVRTSALARKIGLASRDNGSDSDLDKRLEKVERKIKDWERILPH